MKIMKCPTCGEKMPVDFKEKGNAYAQCVADPAKNGFKIKGCGTRIQINANGVNKFLKPQTENQQPQQQVKTETIPEQKKSKFLTWE